jgi:hypothetical protein
MLSSVAAQRSARHTPSDSTSRVTVITSFHAKGFAQYGTAFVDSFRRHWPDNYDLWIYAEDFEFEPPDDRIRVLDLHATIPALHQFKRKHGANPVAGGQLARGYDYRFDAIRFANKAYVMCDAARKADSPYLLWLDGDTRAFLDIPADFLRRILTGGEFMAYLGRMGYHTETGFLPFNLQHPSTRLFFDTLESMYRTDAIFTLREWHDCEALDTCRAILTAQGHLTAKNLNTHSTGHPFINSVAGLFMDHMKGPTRKGAQQSAASDYVIPPPSRVNFYGGRYAQIPPLMKHLLPTEVVEVGTWSGWRGVQMAMPSLAAGKPVHYKGYDVFEQYTAEFDAKEMNVKPHFSLAEVERLLGLVSEIYPRFTFELVQGNTNETLKDERVEFVFLDGGHSVETIQSDFNAVRNSQVVLLDDYYAGGIDTTLFGCNRVIQELEHQVLPIKDPVQGGGTTQFAWVSELRLPPNLFEGTAGHRS